MEIRPLRTTDDRFAVSRIYEESWKFAYRGIVPQNYLENIPAGHWASGLEREGWDTLVMMEDSQLIGTSSFCASRWPDFPGCGEIVSLYLLPDRMGKDYGKPLLEAAVRALNNQGFQDILLWVLEENHRARAFYERAGFRPGGACMETVVGGKALKEMLYTRTV